jgi:choline dehydrogenase-like flavoprotein
MAQPSTDFLIVGGGSAGCVLAARLSEDPGVSVTLLEAGGTGDDTFIRTPAAGVAMLPSRLHNWHFETVPQPGLNGRRGYQPRGKVLGGSSAINAMVYIRGHRSDYDHWAALGNRGWSYEEVLPYFRRAEHNERLHDRFHGQGGPLNVADSRSDNPYQQRYLAAAREAGFALNDDFNGAEQEGLGLYQLTQKNGERCSVARAYLHPLIGQRSNLTVLTRTQARRIVFEGRRAVGVELDHGGERKTLRARREVIVSAGALLSPQLLLVSGVGDADQLHRHGVPLVHHLPGVGRNLQDHPDFIFGFQVPDLDLVGLSPGGLLRTLREIGRYRRERRGMMTSNYAEAGGFLRLLPSSPAPDVQFHFVIAVVEDHARKLHLRHGLSLHVCLLRPRSRGSVTLAGPTMAQAPLIDPQFLAEADDLERMLQGYRLAERLLQAPSLKSVLRRDLFTAQVKSDDDVRAVLRQRCDTVYHPVGTCAMGSDATAVVDAELRVHGLEALRVVDASVMPTLIGGNTNAPTVMIAEKASDLIRGRAQASAEAASPEPVDALVGTS